MAPTYYQGPDRDVLSLMPQFAIPKPLSAFDVWSPEKELAMERAQQQMELERMDAERKKEEDRRLAEISAQMDQAPQDQAERYSWMADQYARSGMLKEAGEAARIANGLFDNRLANESRQQNKRYQDWMMSREPKAPSFDADQYEITLPDGKTQLLSSAIPEQRAAIEQALRNQYPVQQKKPVAPISEEQKIQNALMRRALNSMNIGLEDSQLLSNTTSAPGGGVPGPSATPVPTQTPPPSKYSNYTTEQLKQMQAQLQAQGS